MARQTLGSGAIRDRGQSTMMVLIVAAVAVLVLVAVGQLGAALVHRSSAQAAADAAALAGVSGGRAAAVHMAAANGAVLQQFRFIDPDTVEVVVTHGGAVATARATRAP